MGDDLFVNRIDSLLSIVGMWVICVAFEEGLL